MFIKIQFKETTVCYTADQYIFSFVGDIPVPAESTRAAIAIWKDGNLVIDYPLKQYSFVYIMNDSGKTIDSFRVD